MNKVTRYLLVIAMIAAIGLLLFSPEGLWRTVGYAIVTIGMAFIYITTRKEQKKKTK